MNRISAYCPKCGKPDNVEIVKIEINGKEVIKLHCSKCGHVFNIEDGYPISTASDIYAVGPNSISKLSGSSIFLSSEDVKE